MEEKQHQGKSLLYLSIHPDGYDPEVDYPLVILLHGFGSNMHDLAGLCPAIDHEGYIYACPNAPMPFHIGPGHVGYGWTPPREEGTAADVQRSEGMLETFFDEVVERYRVSPGQVILMGFSQGGSMTYRCGLGRPDVFAGLVAIGASMPDPQEMEGRLPARRTQPVFIAHGVHDDISPVERAREARSFLEGQGYRPHYKEYPMRHEISQETLDDLVPWMKEVLPPIRVQGGS